MLGKAADIGGDHLAAQGERRRRHAGLARLPVGQHQRIRIADQLRQFGLGNPAPVDHDMRHRAEATEFGGIRAIARHLENEPGIGAEIRHRLAQQVEPLVGQQPAEHQQPRPAAMGEGRGRHRAVAHRHRRMREGENPLAGADRAGIVQLVGHRLAERGQQRRAAQQPRLIHQPEAQAFAGVRDRVVHDDPVRHAQIGDHQPVEHRGHGAERHIRCETVEFRPNAAPGEGQGE
ncbi:Hypothetical protein APM_0584 [Acidiphilium sp. PM]|nr:Hypothetical protein APM_0584 [Acidiphilium sp. PM]